LEKNRLICGKTDYTVQNLTMAKDKYISDLIGPSLEIDEFQKQLTLGNASMFQILKLPQLVDRIKNLMANGNLNIKTVLPNI